jgi:flagellar basal body-associated protein FliL
VEAVRFGASGFRQQEYRSMANDKAPPPPAAEAAAEAPKKKAGMKMAIAAVIVLGLEGGTVAVTMKLAAGPRPVAAEAPIDAQKEAVVKDAEVKLIDAKLPNSLSGRMYLYDLQVVAKVGEKNKEKVTELFTEREAEIRDKIRTIVASASPASLAEPGLETIRRQISYQLEQDIGKDLLKEVLIPKCTRFQTEF